MGEYPHTWGLTHGHWPRLQTMVGMLLTFWFLAGQTLETTESVSQRHQAQPHQRQGQQCSGVMKLLIVSVLLVIVTLGDAAPLIFAAGIIKGSTIARGIYGLLGIQPENFFTTEPPPGEFGEFREFEVPEVGEFEGAVLDYFYNQ